MKTQIIRIETHDDVVSVKDKMGWGQTPRILLVWPDKDPIINRRLDLVFLKRHSEKLGAQLAFVTKDSLIRYYAERLNVPVYKNVRKAESSHWRPSSRRKRQNRSHSLYATYIPDEEKDRKANLDDLRKWVHPSPVSWLIHPVSRLIIFSLGVLAVITLYAILFPTASIEIEPKNVSENLIIPATASTEVKTVNLSGTVPAHRIEIRVEGRGYTPSTGSITIPDKKARGKIVFTNLTDEPITIPAGTIVSTLGDRPIRFQTTKQEEIGPNLISEKLTIEALDPGIIGNVLSNHILVIEGPLGLDLTATNPLATSKGTDQEYPAPNENDYQLLMENLITELFGTALDELTTQIEPNDFVLWISDQDYEIVETVYVPEVIQPSDQLHLTLGVNFPTLIVRGNDLLSLGHSVAEANTENGFIIIPNTISIQSVSSPEEADDGTFNWEIKVEWKTAPTINIDETISQIIWKTPEDASRTLSTLLPIEKNVKITISPKWWPRIPILPFRIKLLGLQSKGF